MPLHPPPERAYDCVSSSSSEVTSDPRPIIISILATTCLPFSLQPRNARNISRQRMDGRHIGGRDSSSQLARSCWKGLDVGTGMWLGISIKTFLRCIEAYQYQDFAARQTSNCYPDASLATPACYVGSRCPDIYSEYLIPMQSDNLSIYVTPKPRTKK